MNWMELINKASQMNWMKLMIYSKIDCIVLKMNEWIELMKKWMNWSNRWKRANDLFKNDLIVIKWMNW